MLFRSLVAVATAEKCMHPDPATNFDDALYAGRWYEVGKYQTAGGAIFQKGTECTIATYKPFEEQNSGGDIGYSSRKQNDGSWVNATGFLVPLERPGHFSQTLDFFGIEGAPVDYNVIWLDEDSAIEYDCNEHILGLLDYCVHFMSRTPTLAPEKFDAMVEFVLASGLNAHELEYAQGVQEGCWEQ